MAAASLDWTTFVGLQSTKHSGPPGEGCGVGAAAFKCPCCDDRGVVVACVAADGLSIAVQLGTDDAVALARRILEIAARQPGAAPGARVQ